MAAKSRPLYRDLNSFLKERFGCRVQKVSLDAGLTCPNRDGKVGRGGCIYCNALGSGTGRFSTQSIKEQIENGKASLRRRYKAEKFIAYFQSYSNTYGNPDKLAALYREALSVPDIVGLAIGTRPDCVDEAVLELLSDLNRETYLSVEYGLQSAHDDTLKAINRGHTFSDFAASVEKTRRKGIDICVHVILGLPGETRRDMLETAQALAGLDIQAIKIHLLYIVRGTPLEALYAAGAFKCIDRETYADIVAEFLALLPPEIVVHRLTGDPHPSELVAPQWAIEKQRNLQAIHLKMHTSQLWQGKHFRRP